MKGWRTTALAAAPVLVSAALAGCAIVDQFSGRAVEYNVQAEQSQQQQMLLNIVRAMQRRPMQFTALQSITGTASASGSVNGGYTHTRSTPYISLFGLTPPASSSLISATAVGTVGGSASMSGGPTFTVPVLDTQEFYQGVLSPIPQQIVDYYLQLGYPREILFMLFYSKIDVTASGPNACYRATLYNSVGNPDEFRQFMTLGEYLLASGFTTERISDSKPFGPPITYDATQPLNATNTAQIVDALTKASSAGLDIRREGNSTYWLEKKSSGYRVCFSREGTGSPDWLKVDNEAYCGNASLDPKKAAKDKDKGDGEPKDYCGPSGSKGQGAAEAGSSEFHGISISRDLLDLLNELRPRKGASQFRALNPNELENWHLSFRFYTRSVEGILYYLGEITRAHLAPEHGGPRIIRTKSSIPYGALPRGQCSTAEGDEGQIIPLYQLGKQRRHALPPPPHCDNLFMLDRGPAPDAILTVDYDGETYSVPRDPVRAGRTMQVLELVKQLLALNTSSKQLPQTTVISVIGGSSQ
jgi:hypothetical protein